ncbi:Peroxisome biosynthesis protein pex1, partial [Linderina pennispora]
MVFKISWANDRLAYVAWSGGMSRSEQRDRTGKISSSVLEIDGTFGSQLGLTEGAEVSVEFVPSVSTCTAAEVVPAHFDDWEILELNAGAVEERLLQQARVVAVDQPIVFWLNSSTSVCLHTKTVTPKGSVCLLDNDTEVMVAPMVRSHGTGGGVSQLLTDDNNTRLPRMKVACMRVAVDHEVEIGSVYVNASSATSAALINSSEATNSKRNERLVCIAHITNHNDKLVSDNKQQSTVESPSGIWLSQLVTSPDVQPGILLVNPVTLEICGGDFSVGELVRVEALASTRGRAVLPVEMSFISDLPDVSDKDIKDALLAMLGDRPSIVVNVGSQVIRKGSAGEAHKSLARVTSFLAPPELGAEGHTPNASEIREVALLVSKDVLETLEINCTTES